MTTITDEIKEAIYEAIRKKSTSNWNDVLYLGDILEVKLNEKEKCADIYKFVDPDLVEDDHDWDDDYLTTLYFK